MALRCPGGWATTVLLAILTAATAGADQLTYSTYLGGSWDDSPRGVAVAGGRIYVTGGTNNADSAANPFPTTPGAYDTSANGPAAYQDAFVAVFEPNGNGTTDLLYSTFLGGAAWDEGRDIAVSGGSVYITGATRSTDFPTTPGAYDVGADGSNNAFVAVFDATLSTLQYSTILKGPSGTDGGHCIDASQGRIYVAGLTQSTGFPVTPGAFSAIPQGNSDVFVSVLNPAGAGASDLLYSTRLGGTQDEVLQWGCLEVQNGMVHITGKTGTGFPTTPGAYDNTHAGNTDVFVSILDPAGNGASDLVASTLLGGSDGDMANGIALDSNRIVVTGTTSWSDGIPMSIVFPTTLGAYDRLLGDGFMPIGLDTSDAFLSIFDSSLSNLVYSTFLGGETSDGAVAVAVVDGDVYIAGTTYAETNLSEPFPTTEDAFDDTFNNSTKSFLSVLNPAGTGLTDLIYSTLLGHDGIDSALAMDVYGGAVHLVGHTGSSDFPTTPGAFDTTPNGFNDVFVTQVRPPCLQQIFADGFESGDTTAWQ